MNALLVMASAESGGQSPTLFECSGHPLHRAACVVGATGVLVIALGVLRSTVVTIKIEATGSKPLGRSRLSASLGRDLLRGLAFLVAADFIATWLAPESEYVLVLGAIVIISTAMSISFHWELKQHTEAVPVQSP